MAFAVSGFLEGARTGTGSQKLFSLSGLIFLFLTFKCQWIQVRPYALHRHPFPSELHTHLLASGTAQPELGT